MVFFKIGIFTFGGGFAMIPLIEKEMVTHKKWIEPDEIINLFAVAQSVPGSIAINVSTLVGFKIAKRKGAIISTFGVIMPSFLIILAIATIFSQISDSKIVHSIFTGINGAVVVMILLAAVKMIRVGVFDLTTAILLVLTFISIVFINVNPIYAIAVGASVGVFRYWLLFRRKRENI